MGLIVDNSLVEVYANDVFVLATRIYPWADDANGIHVFANESNITFGQVEIWDGLASVSAI
jgi:beta-fructofuranosidase